ncbi:FAD/NAD(P)-binding protein [Geomonas paludis]|uniref:FAD/NAD(P)-binding protein n=1 Tax=Geomonas paludis TaxID=2740185 RepID=A0A6V8MWC6_9BACT|nr:FAD/NAD(P)-binding protein [Geomonas paludis]UPU34178.1 FAD/NAD(P)-binding protein [Geomonas paludis]GFO64154.1 oxidoreductase [Geomonas paludis]
MKQPHHSPHLPYSAYLVERRDLSEDTSLFRIAPEADALTELSSFVPGQFVQLSVPGGGEIPISPADLPAAQGTVELCVRRVGHVTELLHKLEPGAQLGLRGPFGCGFPLDDMAGRPVLLLAGGLGIAPLRSLLMHLLRQRERYGDITLMYGAKQPGLMLFREELAALAAAGGMRLYLTVDFAPEQLEGGYSCAIGLLPDLLKGFRFDAANTYAAVCGPPPLYRCLVADLERAGVAAQRILLSLERRMRCGVGRCCHCAIGQKLCCVDGPVFRASDLKGIPEAL